MLPRERIIALLDAAAELGLFVLLEAFDAADLELARQLLLGRRPDPLILVGINSRDLQTLQVVPERFSLLAPLLPRAWHCVAESGVGTPQDGYRVALIGTALMGTDDPAALLAAIVQAARTVQA